MVIATAAIAPGAYTPETNIIQGNKSAAAITKGQVLIVDPADEFFKTAPASAVSTHYGVAIEDALAADTKVRVAVRGPVTVTASGTIPPHAVVKVGATPGQIIEGAQTAIADVNAIVGHYMGKADNNERDGLALGNASAADVVWIFMSGGEAY
jgi:hypothetical protein